MQIKSEPIGDLAVISRLISDTGFSARFDEHFKRHHLWRGMSLGKTLQSMLMYILSESDHRLYTVESWAEQRLKSLSWLLGESELTASQLNDDRLGIVLDVISRHPDQWAAFQRAHNQALIRLYDLSQSLDQGQLEVARMDSTSVQSYRPLEGLFQLGHNAQKLVLPQIKIMLLALDKGNLPLVEHTVSGQHSDDPLYCQVLELAWQRGLPQQGILLVGDSKLCNQDNMSFIAASHNYYLGPLAQRQYSLEQLRQACQWIQQQAQPPQVVMRLAAGAKQAQAVAMVKELDGRLITDQQGQSHWQRLLAVCSINRRQYLLGVLDQRLDRARQQIQERLIRKQGRKTLNQVQQAQQALQQILIHHQVDHLLALHITAPADKTDSCQVDIVLDQQALEQEQFLLGWRVMATNAPASQLSAQQAVLCYWEEYRIEQQFHLLLNKCTALQTIFLKKENRIQALIKILILALQYSNLWQYALRLELASQPQPYLTKVVPGNPGMKVHRPTTKMVLAAFKDIHAIYVDLPDKAPIVQIQGLIPVHQLLLKLLKLPDDLYLHPLCQRT